MVVISRRTGEKIVFPELGVTLRVVTIKPGVVRIGIETPWESARLRERIMVPHDRREGQAA
jgi:sRNA-binding carbon storage regulator CsrA